MFPVPQSDIREDILEILRTYFLDTSHAHELGADAVWSKRRHAEGGVPFRA
jgi:hypothetical protein